jgi:hypothetical protein
VKVTAGPQRHRPPLFIGGETQLSKILNPTVKIKGVLVIQVEVLVTNAGEDVFFCLDSRSPGFDGSGLHQSKRLAIEGLLLWGFGIKPFVRQIVRSFQLVKLDSKGSAAKPHEPLGPFSFFRIHLSTGTFCHQQSNQISPTV